MDSTFWIALGSIGTFVMAIAIFITLWWYQKEKKDKENREISEKIIQPLKESLKWIIKYTPKGQLQDWKWQEIKNNNYYLVLKMDQKIKGEIENFNEELEKFKNLFYQQLDELNNLFYLEIFSYFRRQGSSNSQKVLQSFSQNSHSKDAVRNWFCFWKIGGKYSSVNFFELIFRGKTFKELVEESKNDSTILNKEVGDKKCVIASVEVEENDYEEITNSIKQRLQEDKEYVKYFKFIREFYSKAQSLEKELETI